MQQVRYRWLGLQLTTVDMILTPSLRAVSITDILPYTAASVALNREATLIDKLITFRDCTHKGNPSKTLEGASTLRGKVFLPFWDRSCQEMSNKLWSATKIDSQGLVLTSSDGSVNRTIANSWFSVEQTYLQNENWLKISLPSSTVSVADSTVLGSTSLLSKKIRVYPEPKLAALWMRWISASRWCYNQAISLLRREYISKYTLRKIVMDMAPEWVSEQPYNPRQAAVFQAYDAHKAAIKSRGRCRYRTYRDTSRTIRFQVSNWKSGTFYPRATKGLTFKASEKIVDVMAHEPTLSYTNNQWFICYAIDQCNPPPTMSELGIALDPGVRTFMTGFDGQQVLEIGKYDIGRVYRLCRHLDKVMSRIGMSKGSAFKRLRYRLRKAACKIRVRIKNLVSELHNKTAKYLCDKYKVIFLPTFETQQMIRKGKRRLATKTARAMVTLSHYKFKQTLKHQASKHGVSVMDVTEEYTSKTCSRCGHIHSKLGGSKVFTCPSCGHKLGRDLNGAFNIMLKALRDTSKAGAISSYQVLPYTVTLDGQELPG